MLFAGTPLRSGRTPVIIMQWFGMVSITGTERAFGKCMPASRSADTLAIIGSSSGRQPSTTST